MISPRVQVLSMHVLREKCNSVSRSWFKHRIYELVKYYISQTHNYWTNQTINACKSLSVSPVVHQSDTQLLLTKSVNQYMQVTVSSSSVTPVRHSATADVISQSTHVSHCQLVQYYISQTLSYCWGNQSINTCTCKSLSVSPVLL